MAKLHDKETQSIANVVSDVLEGKTKEEGYGKKKIKSGYGEEVKYPHDMFHPETGAKVVAKNEKDHEELSKKGYTHEKPVKEGPEEPRAQGEKEFKKKHVIKKSGENPDGTVTKEDTKASKSLKTHKVEKEPSNSKEVKETKRELTDEQKYKEFFASALKKYGVESPAELDKEKRKEFFNYVDKNYKATNENVNEAAAAGQRANSGTYRSNAGRDHFERPGTRPAERGHVGRVSFRAMDEIEKQLKNLKKAKETGNSKYDDATLNQLATLLGKEQLLLKKMAQADKKAQQAGERGDDDREEMFNDEYMAIKDDIEQIKDKIKDIKAKAGNK